MKTAKIKRQKELLPYLSAGKTEVKKDSKLDSFEAGLACEIKKTDTIDSAIKKIVKSALQAEFGIKMLSSAQAKDMIDTIAYGIMHDSELRKQALLIIDRFAK